MDTNNLSACEAVIMKTIWDADGDISVPDLIEALKKYDKDYARTTVVTFLTKLTAKGFVKTYRKGKLSYVVATKSEEDYKDLILDNMIDFWYGGNVSLLLEKINSRYKEVNNE